MAGRQTQTLKKGGRPLRPKTEEKCHVSSMTGGVHASMHGLMVGASLCFELSADHRNRSQGT